MWLSLHSAHGYYSSRRLPFLRSATAILKHCVIPYDPLLPSRLARAVIPSLVELLDSQSDVQRELDKSATSATGKGRKGKKRARNYEGDEVFKVSRAIICPTKEDGDAVIAALNGMPWPWILWDIYSPANSIVIRILLRIRNLSPPVHSLSARMILWIYITLPQIPASLLSTDASLHGKVLSVVAAICSEIASGTTSVASKSLGLVVGTSLQNTASMVSLGTHLQLHVLIDTANETPGYHARPRTTITPKSTSTCSVYATCGIALPI